MTSRENTKVAWGGEPQHVEDLRSHILGTVLVPGDEGYDQKRLTWDAATFDQHPVVVVLPETSADVVAAVGFAREHHLPIAVQGGGHGHPVPADEALLINFADMKRVEITPETSTAHVEPGAVAGDLIAAAHSHGLAPLTGFAPGVGAVGYLLGGGVGWLTRQYGPGAVSLRRIEIVTADARLLQVDAQTNPELFWGLHGGGGNFGIVTALDCALYPVDQIFGGSVTYPIALGTDVVQAYLTWVASAPDELTTALRIMHLPPATDLPPELRGQSVVMILAAYNGEKTAGEALLGPMRSLGTPLLDTFDVLPYTRIGTIANDPADAPPVVPHSDGGALNALSPTNVETLLAIVGDPASGLFLTEIRHLGGALARQPEDTMPFSLRDAPFYLNLRAEAPSLEALGVGKQSINAIMEELQQDMTGRTLINFLDYNALDTDADIVERTRTAYTAENYRRLVALKDIYDPENVFRFTHTIPPSAGSHPTVDPVDMREHQSASAAVPGNDTKE